MNTMQQSRVVQLNCWVAANFILVRKMCELGGIDLRYSDGGMFQLQIDLMVCRLKLAAVPTPRSIELHSQLCM